MTARTALGGVTVVDLSQGVAGPVCTRNLAQMGARVIKIERPGVGDLIRGWDDIVHGMSSGHAWVNPGKQSVAVDLSTPGGAEVLLRLVAEADVLVENFVPGTLERWGLAPERLRAARPDLVLCRISGFGQTGPDRERMALDLIIQGETGLITTNGTPEAPAKLSLSVADISGAMYATTAVLQALFHRERTGEGGDIDVALFDAVMSWTGYFPYLWWYGQRRPGRVGLHHHTMFPYGVYPTSEGRAVILAAGAGSRVHWKRFCDAIDRPELVDDPRYADNGLRLENRDELEAVVAGTIAARTLEYWLARFHEAGIPAGAFNEFDEGLAHSRMRSRGLVKEVASAVGPVKVFDHPPRFTAFDNVNELGPPELGEHTEDVLAEFGVTAAELAAYRESGAVG